MGKNIIKLLLDFCLEQLGGYWLDVKPSREDSGEKDCVWQMEHKQTKIKIWI